MKLIQKMPNEWSLDGVVHYLVYGMRNSKTGGLKRPQGMFSFWYRCTCAYNVFMGKCDVLYWPHNQ